MKVSSLGVSASCDSTKRLACKNQNNHVVPERERERERERRGRGRKGRGEGGGGGGGGRGRGGTYCVSWCPVPFKCGV